MRGPGHAKAEDAYPFARGEEVVASAGMPVKLSRPLDWLVVAEHSGNMDGLFLDLLAGEPRILFANGEFPEDLTYGPDSAPYSSVCL